MMGEVSSGVWSVVVSGSFTTTSNFLEGDLGSCLIEEIGSDELEC